MTGPEQLEIETRLHNRSARVITAVGAMPAAEKGNPVVEISSDS